MTSLGSSKNGNRTGGKISKVDLASVYRNNDSESMPTFERSMTLGHSIEAKSGSRKIKIGERHGSVRSGNKPTTR